MNSNSLSVISGKSLAENEEKNYMTTKELAQVLGVTLRTVQQIIANKGYEINFVPMKTKGGIQKCACVNEAQATAIKLELQNHSKIAKNGFDTLTIANDLEMMVIQKRLSEYQDRRIAELMAENNLLQSKNNLLMHTQKTYTASEIAKELGLTSAQKLNQILKEKEIQYYRNGTWLPTSKYSDKYYYEIKQDVLDNGIVIYNSRFTQKGRDFILSPREKGEI